MVWNATSPGALSSGTPIPPGFAPDGEVIERSRQRSSELYRLDPARSGSPRVLTSTALKEHQQPMERLMGVARSGMEALFSQVRDAGYVVLLADAHGVVVDFISNPTIDRELRHAGLWLGSCWTEDNEGTCAVALANLEKRAITVHQSEHFRMPNKKLTCSAVPIFAPDGTPLAVLDASALESPDDRRSQHLVLQMVKSFARMAEDANFLNAFEGHCVLRLGRRRDLLEVAPGGLAALDETGHVVAINQTLLHELGHMAYLAIGRPMDELLDLRFEQVLSAMQHPGDPLSTRLLHTGERCYAIVRAPRRGTTRTFPAPARSAGAAARPGHDPAGGAQALYRLAGEDTTMLANVQHAMRVLDKGLAVLLRGESGSGKEAFAKAMHEASARGNQPFVAINCAAIPETLIESELFGYKDGAFTGARSKGARGKVLQAHGGTLFLDEIGDMPLALQTRLLRVLAEGEVTPLGAEQAVPVDVQLVCATHRNLREMVDRGEFRLDLYYRLNSVTLTLPPLRERTDRVQLMQSLLAEASLQIHGRQVPISAEASDWLLRYDWPGNIRQLRNALRAALALSGGTLIEPEHLPAEILEGVGTNSGLLPPPRLLSIHREESTDGARASPVSAVQATSSGAQAHHGERDRLLAALQACHWNVTEAAQTLGICRATVYRYMQKWNIVSPNRRREAASPCLQGRPVAWSEAVHDAPVHACGARVRTARQRRRHGQLGASRVLHVRGGGIEAGALGQLVHVAQRHLACGGGFIPVDPGLRVGELHLTAADVRGGAQHEAVQMVCRHAGIDPVAAPVGHHGEGPERIRTGDAHGGDAGCGSARRRGAVDLSGRHGHIEPLVLVAQAQAHVAPRMAGAASLFIEGILHGAVHPLIAWQEIADVVAGAQIGGVVQPLLAGPRNAA